ncbi:MAG: SdpI family protein [Ktedonobacteraceae bacterium]
MDPAESNTDKILPKHSSGRSSTMLAIVIIVIQVLIALVTYPFMPDQVPTHWDAAGNINGYMPKLIGVFLLPFISIGLYLLMRVLYAAGPKLGNDNQRANGEIIKLLLLGILLVNLVLQLTTTAIALHVPVDMTLVINLSLSVLFIFMGNYLGKLRRNFWGGIRSPWTLSSDIVWERTHRLGGWLFVLGGLLGLIMSFVPFLRTFGIVTIAILISLISVAYSYIVYQRVIVKGDKSLSPPFDESNGL